MVCGFALPESTHLNIILKNGSTAGSQIDTVPTHLVLMTNLQTLMLGKCIRYVQLESMIFVGGTRYLHLPFANYVTLFFMKPIQIDNNQIKLFPTFVANMTRIETLNFSEYALKFAAVYGKRDTLKHITNFNHLLNIESNKSYYLNSNTNWAAVKIRRASSW